MSMLSDKQREKLYSMLKEGIPTGEIAKALGVHRTTVTRHKTGYKPKSKRKPNAYGDCFMTSKKKRNPNFRSRHGDRLLDEEEIQGMFKSGMTITEIAREKNVSWPCIQQYVHPELRARSKRSYKKWSKTAKNSNRLRTKVRQFCQKDPRRGDLSRTTDLRSREVREWIYKDPYCYLTGEHIDIDNPDQEYSLDHKFPRARGGAASIENMGLTTFVVNRAKSSLSHKEFVELCVKVLRHHNYKVKEPTNG
jgi:DNA-binding CsgD family transcriptional regulator